MTEPFLVHGDCLDVLRTLPDGSVDAVICDPPYGLADHRPDAIVTALTAWANGDRDHVPDGRGFMGKNWDAFVPPPAVWDECLRVLKPGGHLAAFAGSRTYDLMGLSIRMAGFEIRDGLQWLYGSGFPHGIDVSKAITATERHGGANSVRIRRARLGHDFTPSGRAGNRDGLGTPENHLGTAPTRHVETDLTDNARQWQGWNTSLKPSHEPIVLARKPLGGTVAATVLQHGTGAINIDACRVPASDKAKFPTGHGKSGSIYSQDAYTKAWTTGEDRDPSGRWPSNVLLSHHEGCGPDGQPGPCVDGCPVADLDQQSGVTNRPSKGVRGRGGSTYANGAGFANTLTEVGQEVGYGDTGGASRFFPSFRYQAKAPSSERPKVDGVAHPTVKPVALMAWLVRLLTPPGGTVLDPFAGSGTTIEAALLEGFTPIGIERDPQYLPLIQHRIERARAKAAASGSAVQNVEPLGLFDLNEGVA